MKQTELRRFRKEWFTKNIKYKMVYYKDFSYSRILSRIMNYFKRGHGKKGTYNDIIIMADTETSKKHPEPYPDPIENHVCAWTISLRAYEQNIVTLYGTRPSEMIECISLISHHLQGDETFIYFHNYAYDYMFLRKFFFDAWGLPSKDLNTKPHYPILMTFKGEGKKLITFKDSYILSQRSLEKWAKDLDVEHKKATGSWDYDLIRNQDHKFTVNELHYIEHDTLAGVECIDKTLEVLHKSIYSIPYTATGIVRGELREIAEKHRGHEMFLKKALTFDQLLKMLKVFHGGYTHGNRFFIDQMIYAVEYFIQCFDFASSYPFCLCACKFPMGKFIPFKKNVNHRFILQNEYKYAFMFRLSLINVRLKDPYIPMPALQESKAVTSINLMTDNGRIISAGYISIYLTEHDLAVIADQYVWDNMNEIDCTEVETSKKDYLPRWFTDYVFEKFTDKTTLKDGDKVAYSMAKAKVNSVYGMTVQKPITDDIKENYSTGEFKKGLQQKDDESDEDFKKRVYEHDKKEYEKFCNRQNTVFNYQIGVWVTAAAFRHLHELGKCVKEDRRSDGKLRQPPSWYYSDTDSCYSDDWDLEKIEKYNQKCKDMLRANGYGPVIYKGREYWLGVAESKPLEDQYSEFKVLGAKRYAGRCIEDNEIHITVAGVPKKGAKCLQNDLKKFTKDFIFPGSDTGKLTHFYIYCDDIYIDENGNEVGDSIDLKPCDYLMDTEERWEFIESEEIQFRTYEED